eukprot:RCo011912
MFLSGLLSHRATAVTKASPVASPTSPTSPKPGGGGLSPTWLKFGYLRKRRRRGLGFTQRWFTLSASHLCEYHNSKEKTPKATLDLRESFVKENGTLGFELAGPHMPRTYILRAETPEDKRQWIDKLTLVRNRLATEPAPTVLSPPDPISASPRTVVSCPTPYRDNGVRNTATTSMAAHTPFLEAALGQPASSSTSSGQPPQQTHLLGLSSSFLRPHPLTRLAGSADAAGLPYSSPLQTHPVSAIPLPSVQSEEGQRLRVSSPPLERPCSASLDPSRRLSTDSFSSTASSPLCLPNGTFEPSGGLLASLESARRRFAPNRTRVVPLDQLQLQLQNVSSRGS